MRKFSVLLIICATTALAHQGVENPTVQARMHNMKAIASTTKELSEMAKGTIDFDSAKASMALASLSTHADQIVTLFTENEDDPKSEAKPEIWSNFTDFSEKAGALRQATSFDVESMEDLQAAMLAIGASCKSCHQIYRE